MGSNPSAKTEAIRLALERFPNLGSRTIARIVLHDHGDLYDNDIEKIRNTIRYYRGAVGKASRIKGKKPHVKPPVMPKTWREVRTPHIIPPGLWAVLNDLHVPFHDIRAVESAISYIKSQKVDGILFNGDLQDCASVSFWMSGRKRDFDRELEVFIDFLEFVRHEFPKAKIVYKPGNHEYRLPRYYQTKAPDLIGIPLAVFDEVLGLEKRGIEYLDYFQLVMAGKLPILHGHEVRRMAMAVNPARGLFMRLKSWGMCGHCHKTSEHTERDIRGTILTTWSVGCLCDLSPDYDPFTNGWNHGFALVNVEKDGDFEVENKRILPSGKVV
jgi:hypothetical protein